MAEPIKLRHTFFLIFHKLKRVFPLAVKHAGQAP